MEHGIKEFLLHDDLQAKINSQSMQSTELNQLIKTKRNIQDVVNGVGKRNVIWGVFGDSMAATKSKYIMPHLENMIGIAGVIGQGNYMGVTNNAGTLGTVQDYTIYPFTMGKIDTGNSYGYGIYGTNAVADTWKIYYINNGASFKVQIDGVDNITINTTSDNTIDIVTITTTLASHSITIVNLSGTVYLPAFGMYTSTANGLIPIYTNEGGNDMINWIHNDLALDNLAFIYADMGVNLWSYEMKENTVDLQARVVKLFNKIDATIPDADKLIFATTPVENDITKSQEFNNTITKKEAIERNYNHFDCFKKVGNYENLLINGWENDGTHPSIDCQKWLSNEFINDFNLVNFGTGESPVAVYSDIKSKKFSSGNFKMYEEPVYKYDGVLEVVRFLAITNRSHSKTFILDLGDGANGGDGTQSVIPHRFKMGDTGCILESEPNANKLILKTTDGVAKSDLFIKKLSLEGMTTTEINSIVSPADGMEVYNTTLGVKCQYSAVNGGWIKYSHSAM